MLMCARVACCGVVVCCNCVLTPHTAPYGSEKAKMNALMEAVDAELQITGNKGVTAQAMIIG